MGAGEPMIADTTEADSVAVELAGSLFRAVVSSDAYLELLQLWNRHLSESAAPGAGLVPLMEQLISAAMPLLEESIRNLASDADFSAAIGDDSHPCMVVSHSRLVIACNDLARSWFQLAPGDMLRAEMITRADRPAFDALLDKLDSAEPGPQPLILRLQCQGPNRLVALTPWRLPGSGAVFLRICGLDLAIPDRAYSVMEAAFGLSRSESRILRDLMEGRGGADIARERGVREDTVKKQIRSLREKTGVSGRAELIRLLVSVAQNTGTPAPQAPAFSVTNFAGKTYVLPAQHSLAEVGGRRVEYATHGPRDGFPVFVLHAALSGFVLPQELLRLLESQGLRLLLPLRPGYGLSDPLPEPQSVCAVARHLAAFAEARGLRRYAILSMAAGSLHGFALQALHPERVVHHVAVGAHLPLPLEERRRMLTDWQRTLFGVMAERPVAARFLALGAYRMLLQSGASSLLGAIFRRSPADFRIIAEPDTLANLSIGLQIAASRGVDAVVRETSYVLREIPELSAHMPATLMHGAMDALFTVDAARQFSAGRDGVDLVEASDGGQLLLYSHPRLVAQTLVAAIRRHVSEQAA